ncbi:HupK protein [Rhodobacter lacus]|uniref:HupK protein n=1 Tax=Rhodobacter lacus TaxID=1641972 RepID=A0ABW5A6A2_9RHOB
MSAELGILLRPEGLRLTVEITPPDPMPLARMLLGRPTVEVAELLPRLFNLCGAAQGQAARLALGLPAPALPAQHEILRDHLAKLCLIWPKHLGLPPRPLPAAWAEGGVALQDWLWGGALPERLTTFIASGAGVAPLLAELAKHFSPGEAVADLPALTNPMALTAQENSPAGRVAEAALMTQAEALWGRGPLWRALGRMIDLHRLAAAPYPPELRPDGTAVVAAARGAYALSAHAEAGRVTALTRVTPTDHLLAPGGALELSLATLPAEKADLAALVVDILDPCVPVALEVRANA